MDHIIERCKSVIVTTPARWLNLVNSVPAELLTMRPAPNEWSALDCLQHLVDVDRLSYPVRIKALLAEQSFPGFNPDDHPPKQVSADELAQEFAALRKTNLELLAIVQESDLDKQAHHAEYGMVTMRQFLHHWAGHDLNHLVQAERALMQPFIQGTGPWVVNYDDHIVKT
ncbi:MAG: DinB family protein [Anaerolineae bacterium]